MKIDDTFIIPNTTVYITNGDDCFGDEEYVPFDNYQFFPFDYYIKSDKETIKMDVSFVTTSKDYINKQDYSSICTITLDIENSEKNKKDCLDNVIGRELYKQIDDDKLKFFLICHFLESYLFDYEDVRNLVSFSSYAKELSNRKGAVGFVKIFKQKKK